MTEELVRAMREFGERLDDDIGPMFGRDVVLLCDSWLTQQNLLREALGWMEGVEPRPAEPFLAEIRAALAREES